MGEKTKWARASLYFWLVRRVMRESCGTSRAVQKVFLQQSFAVHKQRIRLKSNILRHIPRSANYWAKP
jgi:hypothetical protein